MTLNISGIQVDISKKNVKNMRLYVKPPNGDVAVSAPLSMSDETIEKFIRSKTDWIKRHIKKFENHPRQLKLEYVSGETLYVWGSKYFLQIEYSNKNSLILSGDKAILTVRKGSTAAQREKYVREWYREILRAEIEHLLPKWEKKTGLKTETWQIKYMTSRWGSCKIKKKNIVFNLQLAKKSLECLEYVILHELTHFLEKGHNARFYSLVEKYMPKWKEIRKMLNG